MSEHTPGPWKAKKWVGTDPYDDPDRPFVEVGNVHWSPKNWKPAAAIEQTANARLIAAAPEMLEALEKVISEYIKSLYNSDRALYLGRAMNAAEKTIAKAKGEE